MITREQVGDLGPGDVVELTDDRFPGLTVRGPLRVDDDGDLVLGQYVIRQRSGAGFDDRGRRSILLISRAPRPVYVNHPRTVPVPGDVVRQEDGPLDHTWHYLGDGDIRRSKWWRFDDTRIPFDDGARLRLLVDGETGQAVTS